MLSYILNIKYVYLYWELSNANTQKCCDYLTPANEDHSSVGSKSLDRIISYFSLPLWKEVYEVYIGPGE